MSEYPQNIATVNHVEPVPRRVRAVLGGEVVVDTTRALYVWEWPGYPQYYIPVDDVAAGTLVDEGGTGHGRQGVTRTHGVRAGGQVREGAARVVVEPAVERLAGTVRFEWKAMDAWYEEDERVFVHPRNPYTRVDVLRSTRHLRVELDGVLLAESPAPVLLFETGLPTRYYLNRTELRLEHLVPSDTVTSCPYKGTTSGYWSAHIGDQVHHDVAWTYDFPLREVLPIGGLAAFYNERVDITLDGVLLPRPTTHFAR
ncbi:MAG TPA: DUF427 domain-containing protein [Candidatus Dormibacteraeota bacterium]|jgi:uncharacterized protein (DUF427 family)|nr:DUF427 domain-containing protein [Candidatus Dormibacteraeota bacterium]